MSYLSLKPNFDIILKAKVEFVVETFLKKKQENIDKWGKENNLCTVILRIGCSLVTGTF